MEFISVVDNEKVKDLSQIDVTVKMSALELSYIYSVLGNVRGADKHNIIKDSHLKIAYKSQVLEYGRDSNYGVGTSELYSKIDDKLGDLGIALK